MAISIFIKFPAGITGEAQQAGHADEVSVSSVQWGAARAVSLLGNSRETSVPNVSEMVFTKYVDSASNDLAMACLKATPLDEIVVSFVKDAGDEHIDYLQYTMKNGLITSYSLSAASGEGSPIESGSISFTEIKGLYKKQETDHSASSDHEFEYNLLARV